MILFIDTETTGLNEPSMVQYGYILCDDSLNCVESGRKYVKPQKKIEESAIKVHGITNEKIKEIGCTTKVALKHLSKLFMMADLIVGHNVEFDMNVIQNDAHRVKDKEFMYQLQTKKFFCTMQESTNLLRIEKENGSFKYPKLTELYRYLFGHDFADAHDALSDITTTWKCYKELLRIDYRKKISELNIEDIRKSYEDKVSQEVFNEVVKQIDQLLTYSKHTLTKLSYDMNWIKEEIISESLFFLSKEKDESSQQIGMINFLIKRKQKKINISMNLNIEESVEFEIA